MQRLTLTLALALVACSSKEPEPVTEVQSKFCLSTLTGKTGIRTSKQCVAVGKNSCGSTKETKHATEELSTSCNFTHWRDK